MTARKRFFVPVSAHAVPRSRIFARTLFSGALLVSVFLATSAHCTSSTSEKDPAEVTRLYLATYLNGDVDSARALHAYLHGGTAGFESSDEYRTVKAKQDMLSQLRELPLSDLLQMSGTTFPEGHDGEQFEPSLRRAYEQAAQLLFGASCDILGHRIDHMPGKPPVASVPFDCVFLQPPSLPDTTIATARELTAILDQYAASMTRKANRREWYFSLVLRQSADGRWRSDDDATDALLMRLALSSTETYDKTPNDLRGPQASDSRSP
ncbi:MAG: hypothetical protein ACN6PJ_05115 [Achromobacter sp.]|uniref:hypothetical protein n=1 Tax=Achromobacter sp. TaxID=134375 RepID=UPI003D02F394